MCVCVCSQTDIVKEELHLPGSSAFHVQRAGHPDAHVTGLDSVGLGSL